MRHLGDALQRRRQLRLLSVSPAFHIFRRSGKYALARWKLFSSGRCSSSSCDNFSLTANHLRKPNRRAITSASFIVP